MEAGEKAFLPKKKKLALGRFFLHRCGVSEMAQFSREPTGAEDLGQE